MRCLLGRVAVLLAVAITRTEAQSCSGTTTVTRAPSGCATYIGDIVIPTGAQGDVALDGLEEIDGSLSVEEASNLETLSSRSLRSVTELSLENVQLLRSFSFPELTSIRNLTLVGLPNTIELSFLETLASLGSLSIQNTQLGIIEGFRIETMDQITIINNYYLETINLQPYNITGSISIGANGANMDLSMPNIEFAQNVTLRNCSSISMPSLELVNGSLGLYSNYISTFNGAPLLSEVSGGVAFVSNPDMDRIALPELRSVAGGFQILNNTALTSLEGLYSLETVEGALDVEENLESVSFPALSNVTGTISINSTAEMSCDSTNSIYQDGLVDGQYSCRTANESSDASTLRIASSGADDSTNNNGAPNGTDTAAGQESDNSMAIGAGVGVGVGVPLLLALAGWLWWRRRRTARRDSSSAQALQEKDGSEVDRGHMLGYDVQKHELEHPLGEMPIGGEAQELPAKHGQVELPAGIDSRHEMPAEELKLIEKKDAENTKSES